MIQDDANILLVASQAVADELAGVAGRPLAHRDDAYDALEELASRPYDAVVLTCPRPDFDGLVRAVRKLQAVAGIYALCSPAGEAQLRLARPGELTDYFIYPPTPDELARLGGSSRSAAQAAAPPGSEALTPQDVARLVESCENVDRLAGCVLACLEEWTGRKFQWTDVLDEPARVALVLETEPRRVLLCQDGQAPPAGKVETLKPLLAPLVAQAARAEALHRLAVTDHLTGAFNRRYFYHFTDQLLERAKVERFRVTLLLYDIDNFKRYNDTYGHAAGDEILREIASLMEQVTRAQDVVARIGGDEFTMLFWDAEPPRRPDSQHPHDAYALCDRFRRAVHSHEFPSLGPEAKGVLTISGGLATFPWDGSTCRDLLRHADSALRQAKASGKNAIYLIGEGGSSEMPV